jgi:RNA polymerase sigma-70 factor, ECF subfamily
MWNNSSSNDDSSNKEDRNHIDAFLKGDESGFNLLVRKYQDLIVSTCVRIAGNYHDGEDAAQEVFVQVYKNLGTFRGDSEFATWLYRITMNICRNQHRSWWKRLFTTARHTDRQNEGDEDGPSFELASGAPSPEEDLEKKRTVESVRKAIGKLPQLQREIIVLCDLHEKSYDEICSILGITLGTAKSRIARAREALKNLLASTGVTGGLQGSTYEP